MPSRVVSVSIDVRSQRPRVGHERDILINLAKPGVERHQQTAEPFEVGGVHGVADVEVASEARTRLKHYRDATDDDEVDFGSGERAEQAGGPEVRQARHGAQELPCTPLRPRREFPIRSCGRTVTRRLRRRFREGDPDAVRIVYREYGRLVYSVAYRVLEDKALAEEATQQTFLKAWRAAASIDTERDLEPWLATIAKRTAIDVYRAEARRRAAPIDSASPSDPALVSGPEPVESLYDAWEVRRAVQELPPDQQEVVKLQHFEGLTHTQIADRLSVAPGTVKSRSFRAHRRLAELLGHLKE